MIRRFLMLTVLAVGAASSHAEEADPNRLDWLTGCWQSNDGVTREVWSHSEDGHYFGYSVMTKDGHVVFFEQMRIAPAPMPIFNAYPAGNGPFAFEATDITGHSVTFANPEHDFPQKIQYWREDQQLNAIISKADDSSAATFHFSPCASPEEG